MSYELAVQPGDIRCVTWPSELDERLGGDIGPVEALFRAVLALDELNGDLAKEPVPTQREGYAMDAAEEEIALWFDDIKVGRVSSVVSSHPGWTGTVALEIAASDGPVQRRLLEYIAFDREMSERLGAPGCTLTASEVARAYDAFRDLTEGARWSVSGDGVGKRRLSGAPGFVGETEVSWNP